MSPLKDLGVRAASGLVLAAIVFGAVVFGGIWVLAIVTGVFAVLATSELYRMRGAGPLGGAEYVGLAVAFALCLFAAAWGAEGVAAGVTVGVVCLAIVHIANGESRLQATSLALFGVVYVGFCLAHLVLVRGLSQGVELASVVILSVWANDVLAYLVGSLVGRHPMAPRISPKKSWEGFVAGAVGTIGVWVLAGPVFGVALTWFALTAIGIAVSLVAVLGDLMESRLKREASVKDSGTLVPGHGGILDRFDSMLLVSAACYYALLMAGVR